jgi:hypothetical protein
VREIILVRTLFFLPLRLKIKKKDKEQEIIFYLDRINPPKGQYCPNMKKLRE